MRYRSCDLCGAEEPEFLLRSQRLDGPLVRCRQCGLVYVGQREADFTFRGTDVPRLTGLARRVAELDIVHAEVDEAERTLHVEAERLRLENLQAYTPPGGALLDIGSSSGAFLTVVREAFTATGVEPDPVTSAQARANGLHVVTGTLEDVVAPPGGFDAVTMFHVIEHLDSPRAVVTQVRELLAPDGVVMIETPTIDCLWFRVAKRHWRQLIPYHYFFFARETLEVLLRSCDLEPVGYWKVGRRATLRFLADRLRRSGVPLSAPTASALQRLGLADRTVYVNPGDIMTVIARAPGQRLR